MCATKLYSPPLTRRKYNNVTVRLRGSLGRRLRVERGVRQGSITSLWLFNLVYQELVLMQWTVAPALETRAVLRLECSLDCISGSPTNIFIFSLSAFLLKLKKCNYKKCNWVSGSPSILYKLVLSPVPIVHTNFQENLQLVSPII